MTCTFENMVLQKMRYIFRNALFSQGCEIHGFHPMDTKFCVAMPYGHCDIMLQSNTGSDVIKQEVVPKIDEKRVTFYKAM